MIKTKTISLIIPAYNESGFITSTLKDVPNYIDKIVAIDDGSKDTTLVEMKKIAKKDKRVVILSNGTNYGVGYSVKRGIEESLKYKTDFLSIAAGDNQCDLTKIKDFVTICIEEEFDVCRGNRFLNRKELMKMPAFRKFGNSLYSFATKFVSGYYSLFDFQSSFGAIKTSKLEEIELNSLRNDYLFDNSLWVNLNIVNASIKEIPIPVIYADEVSDVNYFKFVVKSLPYLFSSFWKRIYQKYILVLHPIGLFLLSGILLFGFGLFYGLVLLSRTFEPNHTPATTATVMLSVVPFITGFQLILNAFVLDIQNEPK